MYDHYRLYSNNYFESNNNQLAIIYFIIINTNIKKKYTGTVILVIFVTRPFGFFRGLNFRGHYLSGHIIIWVSRRTSSINYTYGSVYNDRSTVRQTVRDTVKSR